MKTFKAIAGILFAVFMLTGCGGNDKKAGENGSENKNESVSATNKDATVLEGAWEIKRAEGEMADLNAGTVYEFKGSKLSFGKGGFTNPGSTVVTDSTFSFQADGNELKFMYDYRFNGDTLVVEMQNSGGQIFHMIKK
ncbi:MAG: hypothetical protein HOP10_05865 [Chitinophagaceae bacterium]|nr:hypothetical protein [Chitinophagaceae bacterium]